MRLDDTPPEGRENTELTDPADTTPSEPGRKLLVDLERRIAELDAIAWNLPRPRKADGSS